MEAHQGKHHLLFLWGLWPPARDFLRSKISKKKIKKKGSQWHQIWSVSRSAPDMNIMKHKLYVPVSFSFCRHFCPRLFIFFLSLFLLFLAFFMYLQFSPYLYLYNKELLYSVLFYKPFCLLSSVLHLRVPFPNKVFSFTCLLADLSCVSRERNFSIS